MSDADGCGGGEKERRTEAEVDGQSKYGLEGEGIVGGRDAKQVCMDATGQKHRPHIEVGEYAVQEE